MGKNNEEKEKKPLYQTKKTKHMDKRVFVDRLDTRDKKEQVFEYEKGFEQMTRLHAVRLC